MTMMRLSTPWLLVAVTTLLCCQGPVEALRRLRIVSPLQALTIWDPEVRPSGSSGSSSTAEGDDDTNSPAAVPSTTSTRRSRFLPKFRAGLQAEAKARQDVMAQQQRQATRLPAATTGEDDASWAARAQAVQNQRRQQQEEAAEAAFDRAVAQVERDQQQSNNNNPTKNPNRYQFVGVVQPPTKSTATPITWYARKKPSNANWSVRLVHVNQRAVLKDLFDQGKVDLFAKYSNTGRVDAETNKPIIARSYRAKKRGLRNLWNFSPKHFFTDSSGMYWRERRMRPGLYTDGQTVYEASYRYKDGRNGMHQYSSFQDFVRSPSVDKSTKERITKRLKEDVPDIVLEE
eukprot:CAMPEP_0168745688 /NCGR_PEP_ID=MMETSP0724-20121128/14751_1 /TAXON_ID=265536 /ORGANISM="Amphiprora sp., Strain CCMP467" /LENGTH=344 /DNA_ID=CAMNT_0008793417 /DNA_START=26 /DNA_END=1060 /DNA_ORIENTATION=-